MAEQSPKPAWLTSSFTIAFVVTLFLTMVIPNSIKEVSVTMLALTALLAWPLTDFSPAFMRVVWMHVASSAVTLVYLVVGLTRGATDEALIQTLFIYIVSPAMWILVAGGVLATMNTQRLVTLMENNAIMGALSVGLFFYLFLEHGGPEAVSFFIDPEEANVNLVEGYSGATMHVFGTLIFMTSALFAMLTVGVMNTKLLVMLGMMAVVAISSGRSALMLSVPIGLVMGVLLRPGVHGQRPGTIALAISKQVVIAVVAAVAFITGLSMLTEIDVFYIIGGFWEELSGGGGSERTNQAAALYDGILEWFGLGAGHGKGVRYLRSERYPWRYEIVLLATIYRVGIIGALIYAWPFIRYAMGVFQIWKRQRLTNFDVFLFAGCSAAFLAAATNPYIEAYTFQWMYVLPVTIFLVRFPGTSIIDPRPAPRRSSRRGVAMPRHPAGASPATQPRTGIMPQPGAARATAPVGGAQGAPRQVQPSPAAVAAPAASMPARGPAAPGAQAGAQAAPRSGGMPADSRQDPSAQPSTRRPGYR